MFQLIDEAPGDDSILEGKSVYEGAQAKCQQLMQKPWHVKATLCLADSEGGLPSQVTDVFLKVYVDMIFVMPFSHLHPSMFLSGLLSFKD